MSDSLQNAQRASTKRGTAAARGAPGVRSGPAGALQAAALAGLHRWSQAIPGFANTPASRLARLRRQAGFATASEAAYAMGQTRITYLHHENGTRGISNLAADRYAQFFGVQPSLILYGEPSTPLAPRRISVVGAVGLHGRIMPRLSHADLPDTVAAPPGADEGLQALIVLEDDLAPAYRAGDVVFCSAPGPIEGFAGAGRECVVETAKGERLLCLCDQDARGTWTLRTYRGKPRHAVLLRSAAPVLWVQRAAVPLPH